MHVKGRKKVRKASLSWKDFLSLSTEMTRELRVCVRSETSHAALACKSLAVAVTAILNFPESSLWSPWPVLFVAKDSRDLHFPTKFCSQSLSSYSISVSLYSLKGRESQCSTALALTNRASKNLQESVTTLVGVSHFSVSVFCMRVVLRGHGILTWCGQDGIRVILFFFKLIIWGSYFLTSQQTTQLTQIWSWKLNQ